MAYNYPAGYQPYYPAQYQPAPPPQNTGIIWVSGEAGAKAYCVAPNTTVQLWDSEQQTIYLKSADASGMPSMKVLDYTIRQEAAKAPVMSAEPKGSTEISRSDLDALQAQIDALKEELGRRKDNG